MLLAILLILVIGLIAFDLGVIHRRAQNITYYEALIQSGFWIGLGLAFSIVIYFSYEYRWFVTSDSTAMISGKQATIEYLTAYIVEKTLSLDNLFVIALIFESLRIPLRFQHRVLVWGILGAILFRGLIIYAGISLMNQFTWMIYVFGAILMFSALKLLANHQKPASTERNLLVRFITRHLPVSDNYEQGQFLTRENGRLHITTLFVAILLIETADLLFAVDSIPAVIAISREPIIVYSSNVFAILGLRALYFVLANALLKLRYLKLGLILILLFIGSKMFLSHIYPISAIASLIIITSILTLAIVFSLRHKHLPDFIESSPLAKDIGRIYEITYGGLKSIVILVIGISVLLIGIIMIFTPGPAIIVIPAGLAILATEFVWARVLLRKFKDKFMHYSKETRAFFSRHGDNGNKQDKQ